MKRNIISKLAVFFTAIICVSLAGCAENDIYESHLNVSTGNYVSANKSGTESVSVPKPESETTENTQSDTENTEAATKKPEEKTFTVESEGDYKYRAYEDEVLIIEYNGTDKEVNIPSTLGGKKVTGIGYQAFMLKSITSVTIPDSVTEIDKIAFGQCQSLTSVVIPDSVTKIGGSAFHRCTSLTDVTLSNSLSAIEEYTFDECTALESITIPNSVTSIGSSAFHHTGLTSVAIPNSVKSVDKYAFSGCKSLISVTIPDSVEEIGKYAFNGCSKDIKVIYKGETYNYDSVNVW